MGCLKIGCGLTSFFMVSFGSVLLWSVMRWATDPVWRQRQDAGEIMLVLIGGMLLGTGAGFLTAKLMPDDRDGEEG